MSTTSLNNISSTIKTIARNLNFDFCGISTATFLEEDAIRLERWLNNGYQGRMSYMEKHFDLRTDPRKLVPGARSVITLMKNYYPKQEQQQSAPKIAKYAYGKDYHEVIRNQLNAFLAHLRNQFGDVQGRGFVDSAPVLERSWAVRSGLGWVGKNGNLLTRKQGSFFFIATLITDLEATPDAPFTEDFCGTCTRCIEECPTGAILPDKVINGSACISYFTIELKEALIPEPNTAGWLFGCDVCQDVCPWNRFSKPHREPEFEPIAEILNFTIGQWEELTEETFKKIFRDSPVKRPKFAGIRRNLSLIKKADDR